MEKHQKSFFPPKYRGKVLAGEVADAAEEIIRENCKELDIEIIDKPFFRKESFTKETIISAKRWKSVYKTFKNSFINNLLEKVWPKMLRNQWGMTGKW